MAYKGYCTLIRRGAIFICTSCKKKLPGNLPLPIWRMCDVNPPKTLLPAVPKHRPRTAEEYVAVTRICEKCDHFEPSKGICLLKKIGCRACQEGSKFAKWKGSGEPCPDGRFPGTPLVEPSTNPT